MQYICQMLTQVSLGGRRVESCLGGLIWLVRVFTQPAHPGYIAGFGRDSVPRQTPVEVYPLAGQAAVARAFRTLSFFHRNPITVSAKVGRWHGCGSGAGGLGFKGSSSGTWVSQP